VLTVYIVSKSDLIHIWPAASGLGLRGCMSPISYWNGMDLLPAVHLAGGFQSFARLRHPSSRQNWHCSAVFLRGYCVWYGMDFRCTMTTRMGGDFLCRVSIMRMKMNLSCRGRKAANHLALFRFSEWINYCLLVAVLFFKNPVLVFKVLRLSLKPG